MAGTFIFIAVPNAGEIFIISVVWILMVIP